MRRLNFGKYFRPRTAAITVVALLVAFAIYVVYLDVTIRTQFEGKRWALPARVYASPLELYPGKKISAAQLSEELAALNYRHGTPDEPGSYSRDRGKTAVRGNTREPRGSA